jgi:hypothetical protein
MNSNYFCYLFIFKKELLESHELLSALEHEEASLKDQFEQAKQRNLHGTHLSLLFSS